MTGFSYPNKPSLDLRQLTDLTDASYAPIASINDPTNAEEQRKRYCGGDELPSLYLRTVPPSINFTPASGVTGILSDPLIFQKVDTIDNVANFSSDQNVSWSISGTNSNLFTINSAGDLEATASALPASINSNYSIIVTATNESGNSTSKSIVIKLTATATPSNIIMIPNTDATFQIIPVDGANLNLNDYTFASTFISETWLSISSSGLITVTKSFPNSGVWRSWPNEPYFQKSGGISANITNTSTGQTLSKSYNVTIQAPLGSVSAPFSDLKMQKNVSLPTTSSNILGRVEYAGSTNYGYVQFQIIRSWFINNGTGGIPNGGYVSGNGPVQLDAALSSSSAPKSWFWICTGDSNGNTGNNAGQGTANIATNDPGEAGASWRFDVGILYWCDLPLYESDGTTIRSEWTQDFNGGQGNYCIAGVNPYA